MRLIRIALILSIVAAAAGLSVALALGALWFPAALIVLLGGIWISAQGVRAGWIGWAIMALFTAAAAIAAWLDLQQGLVMVGLTGTVSAWDLEHFKRKLEDADVVEGLTGLSRRHLIGVLLADAVGLAAGWAALRLQLQLSFGVAILLGLMALVGLSRVIILLQRREAA